MDDSYLILKLREGSHESFNALLKASPAIKAVLSDSEIDSCFTLDYYMKNVDLILGRVGIL